MINEIRQFHSFFIVNWTLLINQSFFARIVSIDIIVWFASFFMIIIIIRGILKSSLYLSSRPLVFLRVAANVCVYIYIYAYAHVSTLVRFNDLWYLTICSTIVIRLYSTLNIWMLLLLHLSFLFQRFIVIWCALCHMYMYIHKGFLFSLSSSSSSSFYVIEHEWRSHQHGMSYNYILLIKLLFERRRRRNQIRNTFLWHDIVK